MQGHRLEVVRGMRIRCPRYPYSTSLGVDFVYLETIEEEGKCRMGQSWYEMMAR